MKRDEKLKQGISRLLEISGEKNTAFAAADFYRSGDFKRGAGRFA